MQLPIASSAHDSIGNTAKERILRKYERNKMVTFFFVFIILKLLYEKKKEIY